MIPNISEIEGTESGRVFLFGGGHSVSSFDFDKIGDDKIAAINYFPLNMHLDYLIHHDDEVARYLDKHGETNAIVISYKGNLSIRSDYHYTHKDIEICSHTPPQAIQILDYIGFDEIVLVGLDYYSDKSGIHYYDNSGRWIEHCDFVALERQKKHVADMGEAHRQKCTDMYNKRIFAAGAEHDVVNDYDKFETVAKVVNASAKSRIKRYEKTKQYEKRT